MKKIMVWVSLLLAARLFAQTEDITGSNPDLPLGYRTVVLGLGIEELKEALRQDTEAYLFREDNVYFVPLRNENYVETTGRSFIKRAFFQLKDASVFVISLDLNPDRIDYYSVFTAFREKYGDPASLDPRMAMWESETVRVIIERPLTVKYIDRAVFDAVFADADAGKSNEATIRDQFLQDF
jgi:hypothetical protein